MKTKFRGKKIAAVIALIATVCILCGIFAACGGGGGEEIVLEQTSVVMYVGDSFKLTANIDISDADWSSSDSKVVTVKRGVLTAVAEGNTTVTVTLAGAGTATCAVEVKTRTISISQETATINLDEDATLTLTAEASDGGTVNWSTSDSNLATVSNGVVTAYSIGEVTITASKGAAKATCLIEIIEPSRPDDYYLLEKKTNADTREAAGTWTYWADGTWTVAYDFVEAPLHANSGLSVSLSVLPSSALSQYFYFRYQPVYDVDTMYTMTFDVEMNVDGAIRYGSPGGVPTTFYNTDLTKNVSKPLSFTGKVMGTGSEPFSVRINSANKVEGEPVKLTVKNIVIKEYVEEPVDPVKEKYNLKLSNNAGTIENAGTWTYWADGDFELLALPGYDDGVITLPLKSSSATSTYQVRYQTTEYEVGDTYSVSFTAEVDAPAAVSFGRGGAESEITSVNFDEAGSMELVWTGKLHASFPFMVQVKANNGSAPITLTVKDVVISDPVDPVDPGEDVVYNLERKTNGETVANPGKWFCAYDGSDGNEFKFTTAPKYDNGSLVMGFEYHATGTPTYQFRYQPEYGVGTAYKVTFKVTLTAAGKVIYGNDYKAADFTAGEQKSLEWTGPVGATMPFMIQVRATDAASPIAITVTDIVFALV